MGWSSADREVARARMSSSTFDLRRIDETLYEIAADAPSDMRVPARVFASERLLAEIAGDRSLEQLQNVARVFDASAATALGLREGQATVLVHSGSRGLGHQVCTDYVRRMDAALADFGIELPDRQLSCAPASSAE